LGAVAGGVTSSWMFHEFMEAITDAHLDAWYDKNGEEVADKCNYNYQACVALSTGSWQIQSEWSNAIGSSLNVAPTISMFAAAHSSGRIGVPTNRSNNSLPAAKRRIRA
jgi:hypothetical protein